MSSATSHKKDGFLTKLFTLGNKFSIKDFIDRLKKYAVEGIGIFIVLYTGLSTFVYFAIKNILTDVDQDTRTQIWAGIDLAVNVLGVITAMFGTSRLTKRFGLTITLPLVPFIIVIAMLILSISPILWVVVGLQVVRRAGEYAITKPAREMLFTTLDRESRFKGKSVIDVVVYRAGDIFWQRTFYGCFPTGSEMAAAAELNYDTAEPAELEMTWRADYWTEDMV